MARTLIDIRWPHRGVVEGTAFERQPGESMRYAKNVRAYDPRTGQFRGSQRSGLSSYLSLSGGSVQEGFTVVKGGTGVSGTTVSTRAVYPLYVKAGVVNLIGAGSFTGAVMASTPKVIFGAPFFGNAYFVDGTGRYVADIDAGTVTSWPSVDATYAPENAPPAGHRLLQAHRGRLFVAGAKDDPENYYACAVGKPHDWRYNPRPTSVSQAFASNLSNTCRVADVINSLVPWTNDTMVIGGDQSLWIMQGDPAAGGRTYQVNNTLGMLWGRPWAFDDAGVLYFVASQGGLYRWAHGGAPEPLSSGRVDRWITNLDLSKTIVRLAWNHVEQGIHVWTTDLVAASPREHLFWSRREDAFYIDQYDNIALEPVVPITIDGSAPGDRKLVIAGAGNGLYQFDAAEFADSSGGIDVVAWLGPFGLGPGRAALVDEIQVILGENSASDLTVSVYDGETVEAAFNNPTPRRTFVATPGRRNSVKRAGRGAAFFLKLSRESDNDGQGSFSFEAIRMWLTPVGRSGQREF